MQLCSQLQHPVSTHLLSGTQVQNSCPSHMASRFVRRLACMTLSGGARPRFDSDGVGGARQAWHGSILIHKPPTAIKAWQDFVLINRLINDFCGFEGMTKPMRVWLWFGGKGGNKGREWKLSPRLGKKMEPANFFTNVSQMVPRNTKKFFPARAKGQRVHFRVYFLPVFLAWSQNRNYP